MSETIEMEPNQGEAVESQELREWEQLDALLSKIPRRAQFGLLKSCDLVLTCIDASEKYIALGSNIGVVFLYTRANESIQKLKTTVSVKVLVCIKNE